MIFWDKKEEAGARDTAEGKYLELGYGRVQRECRVDSSDEASIESLTRI